MKARIAVVFAAALLFALLPAGAALAQPPSNDDFAGATSVTEIPFMEVVDVSEATVEAEEFDVCAPIANTVWYALTLDTTTEVVADSAGSDYDTVIAVWTGDTLGGLSLVGCVDDTFNSLQSAISFTAEAGVTTYVQVAAFGELFEGGMLNLTIDTAPKSTGRPEISKFNTRGLSAGAFMEEFDEETGIFSFTELRLSESRVKVYQEKPYQAAFLSFNHSSQMFDEATGQFTYTDIFGFTELMPSQYEISRQLQSAEVAAELMLEGYQCVESPPEPNGDGFEFETECTEIGPEAAVVEAEWTGSGNTFKSMFSERSSAAGYRSSFRGTSTSRNAEVVGSVAGDTIFFDLANAFGQLSRETSAEMVVIRGGFLIL